MTLNGLSVILFYNKIKSTVRFITLSNICFIEEIVEFKCCFLCFLQKNGGLISIKFFKYGKNHYFSPILRSDSLDNK
jgi:hypothetical protein